MLKGEQQYCPSRGQDLQVFLLPQRQQPHFSPCYGLRGGGEPSEIAQLFSGVAGSAPSEHPHKAGLQPGCCRALPGHIPPAPVLLHPCGEFGPEITIRLLQEAVQMLRSQWPRPVRRHREWQPPPSTSIFCTQSCFPSTAAVPGWRCCAGWCIPAGTLPSRARFLNCFTGSTTAQTDHLAGGLLAFPSAYLPAARMKRSWKRSSVLGSSSDPVHLQEHESLSCFLSSFSLSQCSVSAGNKASQCRLVSSLELRVWLGSQSRMVFMLNMLQISREGEQDTANYYTEIRVDGT